MSYSIYVKTNQQGYVIDIQSSAFLSDTTGWIKIDEGDGLKYRHAQGNYLDKNLRSNSGLYRYEIVNGALKERDSNDINKQEEEIKRSEETARIASQQTSAQLNHAIKLFAMTLPEETALEIPYVYDSWEIGKAYVHNQYLTYGVNTVGDPQLYKVVQAHTSQADWTPDLTPSLYTPLGLNDSGYPIWTQPTGTQDAYNKGDIVDYNGSLYESLIDANVWSPDTYPAGWKQFKEA